jgi:hypothetical protein
LIECTDYLFWLGQNRDRVRLEAGAGSLTGFELAIEDEGEEGELSDRYLEKGMGLMALTGRRPAEIFLSAKFSLPKTAVRRISRYQDRPGFGRESGRYASSTISIP